MRKERLFVVGAGYKAGHSDLGWGKRLSLAGGNTGNLLIGNGLRSSLHYDKWEWGTTYSPDYICKISTVSFCRWRTFSVRNVI